MPKITMTGDSHIGRVRRINEDSFRLLPERQALVVCDGMGGHAAGEVASRRAAETFIAYLDSHENMRVKLQGPVVPELADEMIPIVRAVRLANRSVFETAQAQRSMRGMGTTLVGVEFHDGYAEIGHVGDSRVYRFADQKLEQLTIDHSLLAELKAQGQLSEEQERDFPERNVITRALGTHSSVRVDVRVVPTRKGDWFVLCSDGLCGYVEDADMAKILTDTYPNAEDAIGGLIEAANEAGGHDNVTIAIAVVDDPGKGKDVKDIDVTVPESSDDESDLEVQALLELLPSSDSNDDGDEASTDKIRIVQPGDDPRLQANKVEEQDSPESRKRGFWPWK